MYQCSKCEEVFDVPHGRYEYYTESIAKYEECCPYCESSEFDELQRCSRCGDICMESELTECLCMACEKEIQEKVTGFFRQFQENELDYIFESGILERI